MGKHTCKLCSRSFANGRALGGHMRSHVTSSAASNKYSPSPSSSKASVDVAVNKGSLAYGLRENPKKSARLMSVLDIESDAESGHDRRRSKRARISLHDSEPASSLSTASMEEDVAISLMMLSRDSWHKSDLGVLSGDNDDDEYEIRIHHPKRSCKYQCGTCKKVFQSYQALGGHRASHKKTNGCAPPPPIKIQKVESNNNNNVEKIEHQCPVNLVSKSNGESWIDLNLPAPMEDDAELSAVCDA